MSTIIYDSPVFGPIHSRRLGISLGINLLPKEGKVCSFDCIYCECGLNKERHTKNPLPTADEVIEGLRRKLLSMKQEGIVPDVPTFAGNGEPTLHPHFPEIVDRVREVRDELCPSAKMSILSNATQIRRPEIRESLLHFDNNILKLDTVSPIYIMWIVRKDITMWRSKSSASNCSRAIASYRRCSCGASTKGTASTTQPRSS